MKTIYIFLIPVLFVFYGFGQTPPSVTPTSAFINYGSNVTLTASGCAERLIGLLDKRVRPSPFP